jgi:hypothetical protein
MSKAPSMTPDTAQAIEAELAFLVPSWRVHQKIPAYVSLQAPNKFKSDPSGLADEVARIADFICYKNSKEISKLPDGRIRISSATTDGSGFVVMISVG